MRKVLLPNGQQQFVDANGAPLAAGKVYFYYPNTTNAEPTYQNYQQTVPNSNPVVLNAAGRATIWGTGLYREIVYDQFGNLIWDQITSGTSQTGIGVQTSIGSASITDLGTIASHNALISGTSNITSFGTSANITAPLYLVQFNATLNLIYNATSLILPGKTAIVTSAGDSAWVLYLGGGNWQVLEYNVAASGGNAGFGPQEALPSAATTDIGTIGSGNVLITGTTTINNLGNTASTARSLYLLEFAGAMTLSDNAPLINIPGGQSILTANGDTAFAMYLGGGDWNIVSYTRANGQPISWSGSDVTVASGTNTDIASTGSNFVTVSGTTTITSFDNATSPTASLANPLYQLKFSGILTLTYNATSLILPGAANITTAPGDTALAEYIGSGNWNVITYIKAGKVVSSGPALIYSGAISAGASSYEYDFASSYPSYRVIVNGITPATTNQNLNFNFRASASVINGSNSYNWVDNKITAGVAVEPTSSGGDTKFPVGGSSGDWGTGTTNGSVDLYIFPDPISGQFDATASYSTAYQNHSGNFSGSTGQVYCVGNGSSVVSGVQFEFATGNISGGTFEVYGYP